MTFTTFDMVAVPIIAFVLGALWGYYTGATKWRNRYIRASTAQQQQEVE